MKKLVLAFVTLFAASAFAADLNLNSGDSVVIQPNVTTRVTCGGGSSSVGCGDQVNGLKLLIDNCKQNYSGSYCADKYWPKFKQSNPECVNAGLPVCLDNCKQNYSGSYCADHCTQ